MSRRSEPSAAAQNAAKNQATIKGLLKKEHNKICADCKRNKHPRWASWNLGVFVCIRCSGIHRGMGTHISRVKSVDLDAWTDEQLASVVKWGNAKANTYWEAKLAAGHVPSDSKIENFIRTKYESKRWVMDGPMPDPSTLDAGEDDDVPLNIVQERAKAERNQRVASTSSQPLAPPPKAAPQVDLFGDVPEPPARPSTTDTPGSRAAPPEKPPPPKQQKAADSLLGLDFFGGPQSMPPPRPASSSSTPSVPAGPSRPDLKQSILSLYAAKPQPPPQHDHQASFGETQSPPAQQAGGFGGLDDAFGNLNFNPPPSQSAPPPAKADPFASMTSFSKPIPQRSAAAPPQVTSPLSGGGFFDTGPKKPFIPSMASKPPQKPQVNLAPSSSNDFGDFTFAASAPSAPSQPAAPSASTDLFDFSEPSVPPPAPQQQQQPPASTHVPPPKDLGDFSAFHLSKPAPAQPTSRPAAATQASNNLSNLSDTDAWGSNDAWSTPEPAAAAAAAASTPAPQPKLAAPAKQPSFPISSDFSAWGTPAPASNQATSIDAGWGNAAQSAPKVAQDEDFGDWGSAVPETPASSKPPPTTQTQAKPAAGGFSGGGGGDDLFSNVWG